MRLKVIFLKELHSTIDCLEEPIDCHHEFMKKSGNFRVTIDCHPATINCHVASGEKSWTEC